MTSIFLENGGRLFVYGDIEIKKENNEIIVILHGDVVKVEPVGIMETLQQTTAVTISTDQFPGHVLYEHTKGDILSTADIIQIPSALHVLWMLSIDDRDVVLGK